MLYLKSLHPHLIQFTLCNNKPYRNIQLPVIRGKTFEKCTSNENCNAYTNFTAKNSNY